jgi:hypothetical protein
MGGTMIYPYQRCSLKTNYIVSIGCYELKLYNFLLNKERRITGEEDEKYKTK